MKFTIPLYAKILGWFFLNVLTLGVICLVFVGYQVRFGLDALIAGQGGERIKEVTQLIADELFQKEPEQWNAVLLEFGRKYGVQFALFHNTGVQVAGEPLTLPADVAEQLKGGHPPRRPGFPPGGGLPGGPHPLPEDGFGGPPHGPGFGPPGMEGPPRGGGGASVGGEGGPRPSFMVRTTGPTRYWVGIRLHNEPRRRQGEPPASLITVADSIRGNGLFIDFLPWVEIGCAVVLLSMLFWVPLVRGITRSITGITRATEAIARGRFETRVADTRRDELGRLAHAINQMADRLAGLVTGQKRFLGDIAHELCSPLARIQLSLGILEEGTDERGRAQLADLREEVQEMSNLVNELLSFSKASLEPATVKLRSVEVAATIAQALRRESTTDAEVVVTAPADLRVQADPEMLQRSLANLLRNAIRYAGAAGPITVTAESRPGGWVDIVVADQGPGVPEESLAQLFDPFYRPETARARETGGAGLGLAIVKTCVESCQGSVRCRNRPPAGLEVTLTLRAAEPVPATTAGV